MTSKRTNNIKALSERLGSLKIIEEVSREEEWADTEMSTAPAVTNENTQAGMPKGIIPDPG